MTRYYGGPPFRQPDPVWLQRFRRRLRTLAVRQDGHLVWMLSRTRKGYAQVRVKWNDGTWSVTHAHRMAAAAFLGSCPPDKEWHHCCPVHACVDPAHGQWATVYQHNNARWGERGRAD